MLDKKVLRENDLYRYLNTDFEKRLSGKRVILYGKGPQTEILAGNNNINIVGIMDRNVKEGFLFGIPVVDESDIRAGRADIIVIVARPASLRPIYDRIKTICAKHYVMIYDLEGNNLFEKYKETNENITYSDIFVSAYAEVKQKRIVLYGTGVIAREIIQKCTDYNIVGVLDKNRKSGDFFGKPVLDFSKVIALNVDILVICSKVDNIKYIYPRVEWLCSYNQIMLCDYKGNNLFLEHFEKEYDSNKTNDMQTVDKLLKLIQSHDVISFDIFDTLLMRRTYNPSDVFDIIDDRLRSRGICIPDYKVLRKKAQDKAIPNPNIYEIYDKFQEYTGVSDEIKDLIRECEIDVEKTVLLPREAMVEVFNRSVEAGKEVYLVSDMYLPEGVINEILDYFDIRGYKKAFISCDYRTLKMWDLFDVFLKETNVDNVLHIGDHAEFDGECANKYGIDSFIIKSSNKLLEDSAYSDVAGMLRSINERSMVGLLDANLFNNPFNVASGKVRIKNNHELSYNIIGPLITGLALWFIDQVRSDNYDRVLFGSRDGCLIKKLYDVFRELKPEYNLPESEYFYVSRKMLISASTIDEDSLYESYDFVPHFNLEENFEFETDEKYLGDPNLRCDERYNYWLKFKKEIFRSAAEQRECFEKYLNRIGLKDDEKYAFFDFVSQGTCQFFLEKLGLINFDSFYACYRNEYFSKYPDIRHKEWLYINTKDQNSYENYRGSDYLFQDYLFLEGVMTSDEPSLRRFDNNGEPVFDDEPRSADELEFVRIMHEGVVEYFRDYIQNLWLCDSEIARDVPDFIYHLRRPEYTDKNSEETKYVRVYDDMSLKFYEGEVK